MAALVGCTGKGLNPSAGQVRSQIGEDPSLERDLDVTVGHKSTVGNVEPIQVIGVGLVYKLAGTGSSAPVGAWRSQLENNLRKQGFSNIRELLDDPGKSTSLVLVTALVPAGARKGDPLDVQILAPDECQTTSLKGGVLLTCELMNTDTMGNVRQAVATDQPQRQGSNGLLMGSPLAVATGPVVAGTIVKTGTVRGAATEDVDADSMDRPTLRAGRVWDGAKSLTGRPYYLLLNDADQRVQVAMQIAERLNAAFQATDPSTRVAEAKSKDLVVVNVPPSYRHNHYRFLLVARHVPLLPKAADSPYMQKLEEELSQPDKALVAAIKLEALGMESKYPLRRGLESPSPWVRFASAEALAYLGLSDGAAELARLAEAHPAIRSQCLKALAASDDASSTDRLVELMASSDPNLRFGAFLALRLADREHPAIRGTTLNHALALHRVAPGSGGLVHLTSDGRGEVVLFGDRVELKGPFTLPAGNDFSITMSAHDNKATVGRVIKVRGEPEVKTLTCACDVASVLAAMARLGGTHSEAVEFLRRADRAEVMTANLVVDAIPRQFSVDKLVAYSKADTTLYKADREVAKVGSLEPDVSTDVEAPLEEEPVVAAAAPAPQRQLSRVPGRLFGPKRTPEEEEEPLPLPVISEGVVQAGASEPAKDSESFSLSRFQGRLFKKKPPVEE